MTTTTTPSNNDDKWDAVPHQMHHSSSPIGAIDISDNFARHHSVLCQVFDGSCKSLSLKSYCSTGSAGRFDIKAC